MLKNSASAKQDLSDDEMSLGDLIMVLRQKWHFIALTMLIALILTLTLSALIPKLYEATVIIEIGRFVSSGSGSGSGSRSGSGSGSGSGSADIEPALHLIERVNNASFNTRWQSSTEASPSVKATAVKNTQLVKISVTARSSDSAEKYLGKVLDLITVEHKVFTEKSEKHLSSALQNARDQLGAVSVSLEQLNQVVINLSPAKSDPISALLLSQTQQQLFSQQTTLQERVATLEAALTEQVLSNTKALGPIQVGVDPVSPKTNVNAVVSLIVGGCLGVFIAFMRHAVAKNSGRA
jgi:uncharacterized protein involved in exopolysaccharide biosynthesis